jgi:hypothetical protein
MEVFFFTSHPSRHGQEASDNERQDTQARIQQTAAAAIDQLPVRNLDAKTISGSSSSSIAFLQAAASCFSRGVDGGAPDVRRLRFPVTGSRTESGPSTTLVRRLELEEERKRCGLEAHKYAREPTSRIDEHIDPRTSPAQLSLDIIAVLLQSTRRKS